MPEQLGVSFTLRRGTGVDRRVSFPKKAELRIWETENAG